jgi:hypothetical protein
MYYLLGVLLLLPLLPLPPPDREPLLELPDDDEPLLLGAEEPLLLPLDDGRLL